MYLSYLFKENVFIFELCVMRVVAVPCEFSVVVQAGAARWHKLVELLKLDVDERNYGSM